VVVGLGFSFWNAKPEYFVVMLDMKKPADKEDAQNKSERGN
jgi:hypothetical protein